MVLLVLVTAGCRFGLAGTGAGLLSLERSWLRAQERADSLGLDSLLAPEFALVEGPHGAQVPREEYLLRLTRLGVPDRLRLEHPRVTVYGDSALVTSIIICSVARSEAPPVTYRLRTEDRWIRRRGRWTVVRRSMTPTAD